MFLIWCIIAIIASCQPVFFPNTLAPAKTYSTGKGEVGIRTLYIVPYGADFKIGLTKKIQVSGIVYPLNVVSGKGIYEGSIQYNAEPSEKDKYLHIFSVGGGIYCSQMNYIYEGYYPGFSLNSHISVSLPLRLYEFMGYYNCSKYVCSPTGSGAQPLEKYQGAGFVPEMDWGFDWVYVALRIGLSIPIQFWESANPEPVVILPVLSIGLYGKW
ncbi:MAG: hypothetical protein ACP5T7_00370 [bacterium]